MKANDLITELAQFDPEADVVFDIGYWDYPQGSHIEVEGIEVADEDVVLLGGAG